MTMRFLFVGDSMTIGRAGDWTWRYRMWRHLESTLPGAYEIVGPRSRLYVPEDDAATSEAYADPAFPAPPGATWPAGARAGCTWRR